MKKKKKNHFSATSVKLQKQDAKRSISIQDTISIREKFLASSNIEPLKSIILFYHQNM